MSNEALQLADALDARVVPRWVHATGQTPQQKGYAPDVECVKAAAELRRLHALNAELVEALQQIANVNAMDHEYQQWARAALAKAEASNGS